MESINKLFENHSPQPNKPVKAGDAKASSTDVSITVTEQSATCYLTETKPRSTDDCIVRGDKVPEVTSTAETDHFKDGLVPYATTQAKDKVSNQKESTEPIVIKDKSPKPLASEPTTTTTTKAESTEAAQADAVSQESELHISEATKALIAMVEATDFRAVLTPGPEDFPATGEDDRSLISNYSFYTEAEDSVLVITEKPIDTVTKTSGPKSTQPVVNEFESTDVETMTDPEVSITSTDEETPDVVTVIISDIDALFEPVSTVSEETVDPEASSDSTDDGIDIKTDDDKVDDNTEDIYVVSDYGDPMDVDSPASDSYSTTSTDQPNETDSPIVSNVETLDAEVIDTDGIDHNTDMPVESEIAPTSFTMVDTEMTRVQQNALVASINAGLAPGEHISRDDVAQLSGDGESTVNDLSGIQNYRNCPEWARHVTVGSEFWDVQITADYYFNKMSEQPESSIDACSPLELLTDWDSEETGTPADSTQTAETGADTPTNSDSPALIEDFSELAIEKLLSSSIAGHYMTDAEWYASMQAPGTAEDVSKVYCTEFNSGGEVVDLEDDQENSVIIHPLNDAATEVFDSTSDNHDVDEEDLVIPKEAFISEAKVVETADLTASEPILYYTAKDSDPLPEQPSLGFFFVPKEQKTLDVCEKETAISTKQDELAVIEPVVSTEETQKDVEDPSDLEVFIAALHMIDITPDNSTDISTTAVSPVAPIDTDALFESTPAAALADAATIEHTSVGTDVLPTDNLQQVSVQLDNPIPANASISVSTSLLEFPGTSVVAHNSNLSTLSGLEVENDENNAPSVDIAAASLTTETVCLHPAAALQPQIPETAQPHIPSAPIANNDISSTLETNEAISISFNTANTNSLNIAPTTHVSNMATSLVVKKLSDKAKLPVRGSAFAAGYDLAAAEEIVIPAHGKALVSTGLSMAIPDGTYGRIAPRSGLAAKHFIDTGAGVIDADYRGEVKVLLFNHNDSDFSIAEGDRVAQLILERIYTPEVFEVTELPESVRGAGGFGSTGGFGTTI